MGYSELALKGAEIFNKGVQKWCKAAGKGFSVETFQPALKKSDLIGLKYAPKLEGDVLKYSKKFVKETSQSQDNVKVELKKRVSELFSQIFYGGYKSINRIEPIQTDFKGLKQARNYGKERAIMALKEPEPYEHMVIINKKTNKVIGEYKGTKDKCYMENAEALSLPEAISIEHGHPSLYTINGKPVSTPISWPDYMMISKKGEDIIAFDINGKFSMLIKKPNFKPLTKEQREYYEYMHRCYMYPEQEYLPRYLSYLPQEFQGIKTYKELKVVFQELREKNKLSKELMNKFKEAESEFKLESEEQLYAIDKFWRDFSDELGVIYKTNYEWLKNIL